MKQSESHIFFDPELLGFRIPSSELHSGIPIRVAGFHNLGSNVIIAPEELVPLHGSDFDVDALYVITQEMKKDQPIGYKVVNDQYVFMDEKEFQQSISDLPEDEQISALRDLPHHVCTGRGRLLRRHDLRLHCFRTAGVDLAGPSRLPFRLLEDWNNRTSGHGHRLPPP